MDQDYAYNDGYDGYEDYPSGDLMTYEDYELPYEGYGDFDDYYDWDEDYDPSVDEDDCV